MIICITGPKYDDKTNLCSNGYNQNVIFFCKFMKKYFNDGEVFYVSDANFLNKHENIDIIIQFSPLCKITMTTVKKKYPNCKNVFVKYGHEYYNDLRRLLPEEWRMRSPAPKAVCNGIDEVWISPHFKSTKFYYEALYNAKVRLLPFIWKPDNLRITPFTSNSFNCDKNIFIVEPNINMFKTSLIPILIVNELYKLAPNSFNKLYIIANNNYDKNEYFKKEILEKVNILHGHNKKAYFCPRATFSEIFKKPGILLSHQENCGLNYIYLEALYSRIPWVHNSPFFKETGYYYNNKNIPEGVKALTKSLDEFKSIDNSRTIYKYDYDNPKNVKEYKNMINSLVTKN